MPTKNGNQPQAPRVVRSDRSFDALLRKVAVEAKKNDEAELELKALKALADTRVANRGMRSIQNRVAYSPLSLEETLINSFITNPAVSAIKTFTADAVGQAQQRNCSRVMTKMFLRSLEPDGLGIALLPSLVPPNPPAVAGDLADCGFATEEDFMNYFTNDFAPAAITKLSEIPATSVTLSKKEKDDLNFVLKDLDAYAPQNVNELRAVLTAEKQRLEKEESTVVVTPGGLSAGINNAPRYLTPPATPGSRRAKIEQVLALGDDVLEKRVNYMQMWVKHDGYGKNATEYMTEYAATVPDYDPPMTFTISGDAALVSVVTITAKPSDLKAFKVGDNIVLSSGTVPATADHIKLFKAIAAKFDTISTTPELQSAAVNKLDGQGANIAGALGAEITTVDADHSDEAVLRQSIWDSRQKEFDGLLQLLPTEDYQLFLRHQGMVALAGATRIEQLVDFLPKLKAPYLALATAHTIKPEQQATLDLIIALENLALAIQAEDLIVAGFHLADKVLGDPTKGKVAPTAVQSADVNFLLARENRKTCEAALAAAAETHKKRIDEKIFLHGDRTTALGQEGYNESKEYIEWERKRTKHQVEVLFELEPNALPTEQEIWDKLNEFYKLTDWRDNSTDLSIFIDSLGYDPTIVATPIKTAWAAEKRGRFSGVENLDFADWLIKKLTPLQAGATTRNNNKKATPVDPANQNQNARALAFNNPKRTLQDRSYVATHVDIENKKRKPAHILASKNFMIGRDGNQLDLKNARLKWVDLMIWDQDTPPGIFKYHTTAHVPDPTNAAAQKRAKLGGDLGDGRLTTILNGLKAAAGSNPCKAREPINESGNIWWKYICEADAHEESPFVTVYWAKVDLGTGDVLDRKPIDMTGDEGKLVSQEFMKVYEKGMKNDHKLSIETESGSEDYVRKPLVKNDDVDFRRSPVLPDAASKTKDKAANPYPLWKNQAQPPVSAPSAAPAKANKTNLAADIRKGFKKFFGMK